jgi:hypothetical protein
LINHFIGFKDVFAIRKEEADAFYASLLPVNTSRKGAYSTAGLVSLEQAVLLRY